MMGGGFGREEGHRLGELIGVSLLNDGALHWKVAFAHGPRTACSMSAAVRPCGMDIKLGLYGMI